MRLALMMALLLPTVALAGTQTVTYKLSSGTGFVVNNDGHVVTNAHVVERCQSISILTPRGEEAATLVTADKERDLAVLDTHYVPREFASLRFDTEGLEVGNTVVVLGFPGSAGANGTSQLKRSRVHALTGPTGEENWLQLASVAAKGNSGGPVLDDAGRVIAVVTGIAMTYRADTAGEPVGSPIGQTDVAITLTALRDYLREQGVSFYETGGSSHSDESRIRDSAKHYIVPVRCITDVRRS